MPKYIPGSPNLVVQNMPGAQHLGERPGASRSREKRRLEMDPTSGVEIEALAKEVIAATPAVVQRVEKLLGGKN